MKFIRSLYLENRLFLLLSGVIILFALSFLWHSAFVVALAALLLVGLLLLADIVWLYNKQIRILVTRKTPRLLSLGDDNPIKIKLENTAPISLRITLFDELPYQIQKRDFLQKLYLKAGEQKEITYLIKPAQRGEHHFGYVVLYLSSRLNLISKRINAAKPVMVPVYPSIIQMKKYALVTNPRLSQFFGVKKMRRIGHSYEFEQIKNYVKGDDYRSLNWKATGRHNALMVNSYQDERSQPVYCIIDKSRQMRLPFARLSLMDYAINTTLVISNVALQKKDRAGLITFAERIETTIKADNRALQLRRILESLYNQQESQLEANYELLYKSLKNMARTRSLIILFSNIESRQTLDRLKPILKRIASFHLLVVVFFENTELADYGNNQAQDLTDAYLMSAALRMNDEKKYLIQELQQHGVHTILTRPEDLSINTLNKYLEFKARGMI
jgi:uncharacterized protein (DUF58 family)